MTDIVERRFWAHVVKSDDGCWKWTGSTLKKDGRGCISISGKTYLAPRLSWMIHSGEMPPPNVLVCHACDNPNCVNPDHLWLGSVSDNARDAAQKRRLGMQKHPDKSFFSNPKSNAFRPRGESHGNSILNAEMVKWIREHYCPKHRQFGAAAIARQLGVHKDTVKSVLSGRTWKHV